MDENRLLNSWKLPASLRAPVQPPPTPHQEPPAPDDDTNEATIRAVSAAIARLVRQRRYTP